MNDLTQLTINAAASMSCFNRNKLEAIFVLQNQLLEENFSFLSMISSDRDDLKKQKYLALTKLIELSNTSKNVPEIIAQVKREYPRVLEGKNSRTAKLLESLDVQVVREAPTKNGFFKENAVILNAGFHHTILKTYVYLE